MTTDAEHALLGSCMMNDKSLSIALDEGLKPDDFYSFDSGRIFRACMDAYQGLAPGERLDPILVCRYLGEDLEVVGGKAYIHSLVSAVPHLTNSRVYAQEIREDSVTRKIKTVLEQGKESTMRGQELLKWLQESVFALENRNPRTTSTLKEALQAVYEETENPPVGPRLSYPWLEVQLCTQGILPGTLHVLAGDTSHGKSAAAMAITDHCLRDGHTVLFITLEMRAQELALRLAQRYGVDSTRVLNYKARSEDYEMLVNLMGRESSGRLIMHSGLEKVAEIAPLIRRYRPDLVVLDYLQLLDLGSKPVEGLSAITRGLKMMALNYEVPILALSQLARDQERRTNTIPTIERLRGSGTIGQDADVVLFVWRERDDNYVLTNKGKLIVAKSRAGKTGFVDTDWNGERQWIMVRERRAA